jgi:hypothetical protein
MSGAQRRTFETQVRRVYARMAWIEMMLHWARFYDFGAGQLPTFLDELVSQPHR